MQSDENNPYETLQLLSSPSCCWCSRVVSRVEFCCWQQSCALEILVWWGGGRSDLSNCPCAGHQFDGDDILKPVWFFGMVLHFVFHFMNHFVCQVACYLFPRCLGFVCVCVCVCTLVSPSHPPYPFLPISWKLWYKYLYFPSSSFKCTSIASHFHSLGMCMAKNCK